MGSKTVCLISGGLDSAVATAVAKDMEYEIYALTFDYGQRHNRELESARKISAHYQIKEHKIMKLNLDQIGGSALTDEFEVPVDKTVDEIKASDEIPLTYVPARNTIFLSYALAYAEVIAADAIFIGANHVDYSGYPDCRPAYFEAFQALADIATKRAVQGKPVKIIHPLLKLDKKGIVERGLELNVPFELTWSCYQGGKKACGRCDSCVLRLNGFKQAGHNDPIEYEK